MRIAVGAFETYVASEFIPIVYDKTTHLAMNVDLLATLGKKYYEISYDPIPRVSATLNAFKPVTFGFKIKLDLVGSFTNKLTTGTCEIYTGLATGICLRCTWGYKLMTSNTTVAAGT